MLFERYFNVIIVVTLVVIALVTNWLLSLFFLSYEVKKKKKMIFVKIELRSTSMEYRIQNNLI